MALNDLLASLERGARAEADALVADARARAAQHQANADARIARRRAESLQTSERTLRASAELAVAHARRAARNRVLEARARAIERVFAAVAAALPAAITTPPYLTVLPARLAAARACLGDSPAALRCAPSLEPALRPLAAASPALAVTPDPAMETGFMLMACDGSLDVDETLTARLARRRPELAVEIARALEESA